MFKIEIPYISIELCNALLNVCNNLGRKGQISKSHSYGLDYANLTRSMVFTFIWNRKDFS